MQSTVLRCTVAAVGLATMLGFAPAALAEVQNYTATLNAQSEVPPVTGTTANGALGATYDTATRKLTYSVTFDKLTGPPSAAHFHGPAAAGANAGVVLPVADVSKNPINGEATLTPAQAADLQAGKWYFNIHTAANKGGELRGQVLLKK
jgi:hypothetical protein